MGRKKKPIDPKIVKGLATIQCTMEEIAAVVEVNVSTIHRRFAKRIHEWREAGKMSLRRAQWKRAMNGSDKMLVHLGEQYLDQWHKQDVRTEVSEADQLERIRQRRMADLDRLLAGPGRDQGSGDIGAGANGRSGGNGKAGP